MSNPFASTSTATPSASRPAASPSRQDRAAASSSSTSQNLPTPRPRTRPPQTSTSHLSPHASSSLRPRHSLYGTEDRIVLDLGSRVWKVGFSGESEPRVCLNVLELLGTEDGIWGLEKGKGTEEEWWVREERLKAGLRKVWFDHLMSDPKARKVLIVDSLLLSTRIKTMIARVLFANLRVPSINFAPASMLSLLAIGAQTGLVIDVSHLETTVLPIFHSRPLYSHILSTPTAGASINARLKALLKRYGTYYPPPTSLSSINTPKPIVGIPEEVLIEKFLEEIKGRVVFVGAALVDEDSEMEDEDAEPFGLNADAQAVDEALLRLQSRKYSSTSKATDVSIKIPLYEVRAGGVGKGWILVPGWVRERCAEILFEEGGEDRRSLPELILESLLSLPMDLRKPLASSLLLTGGTVMLPGFFSRLRHGILTLLSSSVPTAANLPTPPLDSPPTIAKARLATRLLTLHQPHFSSLVPLIPHLTILNSPTSISTLPQFPLPPKEGSSPAFSPSLLAWIGGSLAGSLKMGGVGMEVVREDWDRGEERKEEEEELLEGEGGKEQEGRWEVPDWSGSASRAALEEKEMECGEEKGGGTWLRDGMTGRKWVRKVY